MLNNIARIAPLLRNKNALFKRYNLSQVNIRNKQNMIFSNSQHTTKRTENEGDDEPIKYSQSKAATMRINEYRDPYGDDMPWYQPPIISVSLAIFLIYFCILREENDIDLMLNNELGDHLNQFENKLVERKSARLASK